MKKLIRKIIQNDKVYKIVPPGIKSLGRKLLPSYKFDSDLWAKDNPFIGTSKEWEYDAGSTFTLGILFDFSHCHAYYMQACIEESISYKVIDISRDNWVEQLTSSNCKAFMVWPSIYHRVWKNMFDNRLRFMKENLGLYIYPGLDELWMYESKLRLIDWLKTKKLETPHSWIFYNESEANNFATSCTLPIVFKTDIGAGSNGVLIVRDRDHLFKLIKTCFGKGFIGKRGDPRDKQWGFIILQEYLEDVEEWRMVRVGDSYFCRKKGKVGDFHSGAGSMSWGNAPEVLLNRLRDISTAENFTSLNIDFFKTKNGRFLINELHPVFGAILNKNLDMNDPLMGRYFYKDNKWEFEHGYFYNNACTNLRVKYVIGQLDNKGIAR